MHLINECVFSYFK